MKQCFVSRSAIEAAEATFCLDAERKSGWGMETDEKFRNVLRAWRGGFVGDAMRLCFSVCFRGAIIWRAVC